MRALTNMLSTGLLLASLAPGVHAGEPTSATVFGINDALAAGSRALYLGDYESGVRLTLEGLRIENRRRDRARALSRTRLPRASRRRRGNR